MVFSSIKFFILENKPSTLSLLKNSFLLLLLDILIFIFFLESNVFIKLKLSFESLNEVFDLDWIRFLSLIKSSLFFVLIAFYLSPTLSGDVDFFPLLNSGLLNKSSLKLLSISFEFLNLLLDESTVLAPFVSYLSILILSRLEGNIISTKCAMILIFIY